MPSEYTVPPADIALIAVTDDERWRQWCARGATADRHTARMMNSGFVAIFVALSAWLVFQLLP